MADTLPIKWIKDKTDGKFFPFTHEDAVIDENGTSIPDKYATKSLVATKQDIISDLENIRAGATLGATALQDRPIYTLDEINDGSTRKLTNYLPLDGSVNMTGTIYRAVTAASNNTPVLSIGSANLDTWIWRVKDNATGTKTATEKVYGFGLKYLGGGEGNNNALALCSDNQAGTQVQAMKILQNGDTTFAVTPSAPTQAAGTNNTKLATTAFVQTAVDSKVHYVANLQTGTAANYITEPEVKSVKINGSTTNSASSSNCVLQYDTTSKCLKFVFN